jgi:FkbM family methyltransferase
MSEILNRNPTKTSFLKFLKEINFNFDHIIDVGILDKTEEFINLFPEVHQVLIEPNALYFNVIKKNYKNLNYTLIDKACSNKRSKSILNYYKVNPDLKKPSHARISNEIDSKNPTYCGNSNVVLDTLDNIVKDFPGNSLLKIDVDGAEFEILEGAEKKCLPQCSFVIVEAHTLRIGKFIEIMDKNHFELFDIIDICYIRGKLSQVDLIFVNKSVMKKHGELDVWGHYMKNLKVNPYTIKGNHYKHKPK